MQGKLNRLLSGWKKGAVRTSVSLKADGYSDDLLSKYVKGGWLESFGHGVYKLYNDEIKWHGVLFALQNELNSSVHVAGKSAIQLKGLAHNLPMGSNGLIIFYNDKNPLPKWFRQIAKEKNFFVTKTNKFGEFKDKFSSEIVLDNLPIKISSPELAIMELLFKVPNEESFHEAYMIMEGLLTLRPELLTEILSDCKSVKAKRLLLYFAEELNLPWLKKIDISKINLGSGKRVIVPNGKLDLKYLITVPRDM